MGSPVEKEELARLGLAIAGATDVKGNTQWSSTGIRTPG